MLEISDKADRAEEHMTMWTKERGNVTEEG
jgi:hypothetical protein